MSVSCDLRVIVINSSNNLRNFGNISRLVFVVLIRCWLIKVIKLMFNVVLVRFSVIILING